MLKRLFKNKTRSNFKEITVGNYLLKADFDNKLDEYLYNYPNYSSNFARLAKIALNNNSSSYIIDVGANIGDTVALLRTENINNPIVCIEGNLFYSELLKINAQKFENVTIIESFLSDKKQELNVKIITQNGTAKLVKDDADSIIETTTLDEIKSINDLDLRILKVDTDGYDILILTGAEQLIRNKRPILFFEYDNNLNASSKRCQEYILSLRENGYFKIIYFDNYGNLLISLDLTDELQISLLDNYAGKFPGAFPYFDVAVFHKNDVKIFDEIIKGFT